MKKTIITITLVLTLLITGCGNFDSQSIEMTVLNENSFRAENNFELSFNVINPDDTTFNGNLSYQYKKECLRLQGVNTFGSTPPTEGIKVPPKDTEPRKIAVIKEFTYTSKDNPSRGNQDCIQAPLKISVFLYDESGKLMDSKGTTVTIV